MIEFSEDELRALEKMVQHKYRKVNRVFWSAVLLAILGWLAVAGLVMKRLRARQRAIDSGHDGDITHNRKQEWTPKQLLVLPAVCIATGIVCVYNYPIPREVFSCGCFDPTDIGAGVLLAPLAVLFIVALLGLAKATIRVVEAVMLVLGQMMEEMAQPWW